MKIDHADIFDYMIDSGLQVIQFEGSDLYLKMGKNFKLRLFSRPKPDCIKYHQLTLRYGDSIHFDAENDRVYTTGSQVGHRGSLLEEYLSKLNAVVLNHKLQNKIEVKDEPKRKVNKI